MVKQILLLSLLTLLGWTSLLSMAGLADSHNTATSVDDEVYNTCDQIDDVARQGMPAAHYAWFLNMTEEECVAEFGGRTRSELKLYLATGGYIDSLNQDTCTDFLGLVNTHVDNPIAVKYFHGLDTNECISGIQGMAEAEVVLMLQTGEYIPLELDDVDSHQVNPIVPAPETLVTDHSHSIGSPHTHDDEGNHSIGAIGFHDRDDPHRLDHWWYHGGEAQDHIIAGIAIPHHDDHFHKTELITFWMNVPSNQQAYHRYRNVEVDGDYRNLISTGVYEAYRITVEYEYKYCNYANWCSDWEEFSNRSTCWAHQHRRWYSKECFVGTEVQD